MQWQAQGDTLQACWSKKFNIQYACDIEFNDIIYFGTGKIQVVKKIVPSEFGVSCDLTVNAQHADMLIAKDTWWDRERPYRDGDISM